MTNNSLTLYNSHGTYTVPALNTWTVGYDRTFDLLRQMSETISPKGSTYPPYNIIKHTDDEYTIELAVAGFSEENLSIELKNGVLTVEGTGSDIANIEYVHKGIASRSFTQEFALAEYVEVQGAKLRDGILKISLERKLPESLRPRKIAIK